MFPFFVFHPNTFYTTFYFLKALLHVDPTQRLDSIGAMVHPYFTISHAADMHSSGKFEPPTKQQSNKV